MSLLDDLRGKAVVITGGSSGIGAALARAFAAHGASVGIQYHRGKAAAEALAEEIRRAGGHAAIAGADVRDEKAVQAMVDALAAALGGIDVLINNAGAMGPRTLAADVTEDSFQEVIGLNSLSILTASRAALPYLKVKGDGAIINTGSIAGRTGGGPGAALYSGAKALVHTVTKSLAKEFVAYGIRVNCVAPGVIHTPFHDQTPPEVITALKAAIPMKRLGDANDCVGAYLFFASAQMSGYLTGQTLDVNGGQYMP